MRILVTGVTGQVGRALVERLPQSATVLAADRSILDLAEPQALARTLDRLEPHVIFNPAAYTGVDQAEDEPALAARINGVAPSPRLRSPGVCARCKAGAFNVAFGFAPCCRRSLIKSSAVSRSDLFLDGLP